MIAGSWKTTKSFPKSQDFHPSTPVSMLPSPAGMQISPVSDYFSQKPVRQQPQPCFTA
jgi:hypothetical protein